MKLNGGESDPPRHLSRRCRWSGGLEPAGKDVECTWIKRTISFHGDRTHTLQYLRRAVDLCLYFAQTRDSSRNQLPDRFLSLNRFIARGAVVLRGIAMLCKRGATRGGVRLN